MTRLDLPTREQSLACGCKPGEPCHADLLRQEDTP